MKIFENTYVVDTPGFSSLDLRFLKENENLTNYFKEIKYYAKDCKFRNCKHIKEPGCSVKKALEERKISKTRYDNYINVVKEYENIRRY